MWNSSCLVVISFPNIRNWNESTYWCSYVETQRVQLITTSGYWVRCIYRSLMKKHSWVEHLTSLPRGAMCALSSALEFSHERAPTSCLQQLNGSEFDKQCMFTGSDHRLEVNQLIPLHSWWWSQPQLDSLYQIWQIKADWAHYRSFQIRLWCVSSTVPGLSLSH